MNRARYLKRLTFCFRVEAAGALAGELGMLLREVPEEKHKLDLFRRLEAANKILCQRALAREDVVRPTIPRHIYLEAIQLGMQFGEGDWNAFLTVFESTLHPELFERFLYDQHGHEIAPEYPNVDLALFRHLAAHERALVEFLQCERDGRWDSSAAVLQAVLDDELSQGLIGPDEPVGW